MKITTTFASAGAWLRNRLWLASVLGALALTGQAKADDTVQLEMQRMQNKLNQLTEQRISTLEKRVALLEAKVGGTAYQPGSPPPAMAPTYAPSYTPSSYVPALPSYASPTVAIPRVAAPSGGSATPPCPLPSAYK